MTLTLNFTELGSGPPLILLHGLFGSGRNWNAIARQLGERFRVLTPDLRNHGNSPWDETMDYPALAADVRTLIERESLAPCAVLGHSMGGKTAMLLALESPDLVERLMVVDIAPVDYPDQHSGYINAMRGLDLDRISRRGEADAALKTAIPEPDIRGFLLQNLLQRGERFEWRLNLDVLAEQLHRILSFPDLPPEQHYPGPALVIGGDRSDYILPEHHAAIHQRPPEARIEMIAGASHWVHAEKPQQLLDRLLAFL